CPHRGASLFFGRNEEGGMRCVYHGWKTSNASSPNSIGPLKNRYAIAVSGAGFGMLGFSQIFNAPNSWRLDGGKLIKDREAEEFKASVGFVRDLYVAGLFHPNKGGSYSLQVQATRSDFIAGRFMVHMDSVVNAWADFWQRGLRANPPVDS